MTVNNGNHIGRIFNGLEASTNIPWHVKLQVPTPHNDYPFTCSGTILDNITILTTANCVESVIQTSSQYLVFAGVINQWDQSAQKIPVDKTFVHPQFDEELMFANIAVLKLKTQIHFQDGVVQPACLPDSTFDPIFRGTVVASGWGVTSDQNLWIDVPQNLQVYFQERIFAHFLVLILK